MTQRKLSTLNSVDESKPQLRKDVLVAALGIIITAITMGINAAPARGTETTIKGQNDPEVDFDAVQNAIDNYYIVNLQGTFDFTNITVTKGPLRITSDVIIRGAEPTGSFTPDPDNWVDERDWSTKIVVNNANKGITITIDNPGGIVEFANLSIESGSERVIVVGDVRPPSPRDACKDLKVRNCKIVATRELGICIETWGGLTGTCYIEGNYFTGPFCIGEWALWQGFMGDSKWEIYSNTLFATGRTCIAAYGSKGFRMESNQCEGPALVYCPSTQGEIVVKNNKMIQSGYYVDQGLNNVLGLHVSHRNGYSGGEISGNSIQMNPSEDVQLNFVPVISLADFEEFDGAHGLLVQDNTITGKADYGIVLDNGASDNIIRRNNLESLTAIQYGLYGASQIIIQLGCHNNIFTENIIGPLAPEAFGGIVCRGINNDIIRNDYTCSNIPGLTSSDQPCVILGVSSERNLVFESGGLPLGTGSPTGQVLDLPREPTSRGTGGTTSNIVVEHSADVLAENINPGVGQRVREALAIFSGLMSHWPLDETEGDFAYDSIDDNHGALRGNPTWQPNNGQVAGALEFDGVDDYITTDFILNPANGPFSVFAWINGGAPGQTIISQTDGTDWLSTDPSDGSLITVLKGLGRGAADLISHTIITDGNWHRIGLVWDGLNRALYVDDILVAEDTQNSLKDSDNGLYIGCGKNMEAGTFWSGLIDDVRIYNRVVIP